MTDTLRAVAGVLPVQLAGDTIVMSAARVVFDVQRHADVGAHLGRLLTRQEGEP